MGAMESERESNRTEASPVGLAAPQRRRKHGRRQNPSSHWPPSQAALLNKNAQPPLWETDSP